MVWWFVRYPSWLLLLSLASPLLLSLQTLNQNPITTSSSSLLNPSSTTQILAAAAAPPVDRSVLRSLIIFQIYPLLHRSSSFFNL
jgi:hypothetical protein